MANVFARTTGQWALTSTWNTSALPTVNDDVYSNGFTVTISAINPQVLTIRNTAAAGIAAGGGFVITNGVSLTAGVVGGGINATNCLTFSENFPSTCTLYGNLCAFNNAVQSPLALSHAGTGTLTVYGTAVGSVNNGTNPATAYISIGAGIFNFIGDIYSSSVGSVIYGIRNTSTGTINITGNIFGVGSYGAVNSSTGVINLYGNSIGGLGSATNGILNNSTGFVNVFGSVIGGNAASGGLNNSTGVFYATKAVGNAFGLGSTGITSGQVGLANSQNGRAYVEQVEFGPRGQTPISGPVYIIPSNRNTLTGYITALGNTVTFYNSLSVDGLLPPVSSVQAGVVYNVGNSVGTMAVPSASAVQFGVAVDNTVGTAALQPQDVWGYSRLSATQVDSMGDRLRNTATTQSIGYQIASFNL